MAEKAIGTIQKSCENEYLSQEKAFGPEKRLICLLVCYKRQVRGEI